MIDVHAHLNFQDFAKDYWQVAKSFSLGVKAIINVGANFETSEKAVLVAQEIPFVLPAWAFTRYTIVKRNLVSKSLLIL